MCGIDKRLELAASQRVPTLHGLPRIPLVASSNLFKSTAECAGCGCKDGQFHTIGCVFEECPICHLNTPSCGCSHD